MGRDATKSGKSLATTVVRFLGLDAAEEGDQVKNKTNGPLAWVTALGCLLSIVLFITSIVFGDGMSLLATISLSLLSTLVGAVNKSKLKLQKRVQGQDSAKPPAGDLVVRNPNGSFLVVKCTEEIARELYFAPEEIEYNIESQAGFRLASLVGTMLLMLGVIFLANAKLQLQFAWAGSYVILNAGHWVAAALPQRWHWDLSCYAIKEQGLKCKEDLSHSGGRLDGPNCKTFTEALWKTIVLTKSTQWVLTNSAAPGTDVWKKWLAKAGELALRGGSEKGRLHDQMWPEEPKWEFWKKHRYEHAADHTIWLVPEWDAKHAWNEMNNQSLETVEKSAVDATRTSVNTSSSSSSFELEHVNGLTKHRNHP